MDLEKIKLPLGEFSLSFVGEIESHKTLGLFKESEQSIIISKKQHPNQIKQTLIHEILHGSESVTGNRFTEKNIDSLAYYILYVIQNNPELISYLQK